MPYIRNLIDDVSLAYNIYVTHTILYIRHKGISIMLPKPTHLKESLLLLILTDGLFTFTNNDIMFITLFGHRINMFNSHQLATVC